MNAITEGDARYSTHAKACTEARCRHDAAEAVTALLENAIEKYITTHKAPLIVLRAEQLFVLKTYYGVPDTDDDMRVLYYAGHPFVHVGNQNYIFFIACRFCGSTRTPDGVVCADCRAPVFCSSGNG